MNDEIKTILADVTVGDRLDGTKSISGIFESYDEKTDELVLRVVGGDELVVFKGVEIVTLNKVAIVAKMEGQSCPGLDSLVQQILDNSDSVFTVTSQRPIS
ncbi:hypothetical protein ACIOZM_06010 [Pseudomonas sp. NPDC087346]|uniref:hypothetical protein n=1 Tax=Pseudomonas sp. NPDC087346 TaxID=3364438 RepID=UPI003827FA57